MLTVFLSIACCLSVAAPSVYAQDQYAIEIGVGMTVTMDDDQDVLRLGAYTYEVWLKDLEGPTGGWRRVFHKGLNSTNTGRGPLMSLRPNDAGIHFSHSTGSGQETANLVGGVPVDEWTHVALVLTALDGDQFIYQNGVEVATTNVSSLTDATQEPTLQVGAANSANVILDDFRVWNFPKTETQILEGMGRELQGSEEGLVGYWRFNEGQGDTASDSSPSALHGTIAGALWSTDAAPIASAQAPGPAHGPTIANGAVDVPRDVVLAWQAGPYAQTHNVYFGTASGDVNDADPANPLGVLVSEGQTETRYDAGVLDYGQTYYWRVDEVNGAPDNTVYKGMVWDFEVEPFSIPVANVTATASSSHDADMSPQKTIDGSGLDELDQHSNEPKDMWLSGMGDPTPSIQYEFDKAYKLHEMWVWNSNQSIESFVGLGAKDVVIEVSLDGADWTILEDTPPFAQATGLPGYAHNTTIDLGGVQARYVKLTLNAGWGMVPQHGLSEVRVLYIPTFAREAQPADGDVTDNVEVALNWRAGREAAVHEVYLGTDPNDLVLADTVTGDAYPATDLNYATTYHWQIVEVNDAEDPRSYAGDILSFSTPAYGVVDDFDQYDNDCQRIFFAWVDGLGHNGGTDIDDCDVPPSNGNGGGSIVGNASSPFAENTIVKSGQSMPFEYNNSLGTSETTLALAPQDWTAHGTKSLSLYFHGDPANTGQLYVRINTTKILYDGLADALQRTQWLPWNIDLSTVAGNLQSVTSFAVGIDGATASGILYVDDIRLYPLAPEVITPVDPDPANLVAYYPLDGDYQDASGNNRHGTPVGGDPTFSPGVLGQALNLNFVTITEYVEITGYQGIAAERADPDNPVQAAFTVACWINTIDNGSLVFWGSGDGAPVGGQYQNFRVDGGRLRSEHGDGRFRGAATVNDGEWHHVALAVDTGTNMTPPGTRIFVDGLQDAEGADTVNSQNLWNISADVDMVIGARVTAGDRFFIGSIDEVRVYDRALSNAEIAWLAGMTQAFDKPFD